MANHTLLLSSFFFGIINIAIYLHCEINNLIRKCRCPIYFRYLEIISLIIIFTSIVNHATTNNIYKWFDRIAVIIGFIICLIIYYKYKLDSIIVILLICIILYGSAKYDNNNLYHILAHLLITINNFIIYYVLIYQKY
jgi:hypothetical protein